MVWAFARQAEKPKASARGRKRESNFMGWEPF
jgi:hypothetical protein